MEESEATEVKANFAFDIDPTDQTLVLWKDGKTTTFSYWDCILLYRILDRQLNH